MHLADYEYDEAQIHEISYAEISIQWSVTLRNTVRDPQFVWVCCELKNSEIIRYHVHAPCTPGHIDG